MKKALLPVVILLLFTLEIMRIFFIMPFPGSQTSNTIGIAWFIHKNIIWIRAILLIVLFWQIGRLIKNKKYWRFGFTIFFCCLYGFIAYFLNFRLNADKMFYQPEHKIFASAGDNKVSDGKLVLGVSINGESKAYPIEIIGYHHQVQDTVGGKPIMVTYCTVCRTGRIFDPVRDGKKESYRLVGMDHFNAMFEDATTGTWWRQATGEAVAGPLKGEQLEEIFSEQTTLAAWLRDHPESKILQPDPKFLQQYKDLTGYDEGTINSDLEYRDFGSWKFKSWVLGVNVDGAEKAYDWNKLEKDKLIADEVNKIPIIITVEKDTVSFHAYKSTVDDQSLHFMRDASGEFLTDNETGSKWGMNGSCYEGINSGKRLIPVPVHQEFYHSWKQFHPETAFDK